MVPAFWSGTVAREDALSVCHARRFHSGPIFRRSDGLEGYDQIRSRLAVNDDPARHRNHFLIRPGITATNKCRRQSDYR